MTYKRIHTRSTAIGPGTATSTLSSINSANAGQLKVAWAKKFTKDYQADGFPYPKDFAKAQDWFTVANATNGAILTRVNLGTAAKAGPITYMHGGKQYFVQALGGTPGFGRDEAWNAEFGSIVVGFTR